MRGAVHAGYAVRMTLDQTLLSLILVGALALFMHGRLRYDVVALLALLATGVLGLVPPDRVFAGFGHRRSSRSQRSSSSRSR